MKLKEISYIHAEGYPAGEMKHGPNALIDERLPVVFINTAIANEPRFRVALREDDSNIVEVKAREGIVISVVTEGDDEIDECCRPRDRHSARARTAVADSGIVPLQLLAYHIAVRRGCDVDQPRNLAKSVTVE